MKIHPLLLHGRFLFIVDDCVNCMIYKKFIDRVNAELRFDKRVEIINCTNYHNFGIIENPIIRLFKDYVNNEYPVLFINGRRKDGTNTRIEAETWLRARLHNDFEEPRYNGFMFNKQCEYVSKGLLRKKILCN